MGQIDSGAGTRPNSDLAVDLLVGSGRLRARRGLPCPHRAPTVPRPCPDRAPRVDITTSREYCPEAESPAVTTENKPRSKTAIAKHVGAARSPPLRSSTAFCRGLKSASEESVSETGRGPGHGERRTALAGTNAPQTTHGSGALHSRQVTQRRFYVQLGVPAQVRRASR
jgi:hypothetical protein